MRYFTVVLWVGNTPKGVKYIYDNYDDAEEAVNHLLRRASKGENYSVAELVIPKEAENDA